MHTVGTFQIAAAEMDVLSTRLARLSPLDQADIKLLQHAEAGRRFSPARREMVHEGEPMGEPEAMLSGWACRQRILEDGRRQILAFLLPGDLIGLCRRTGAVAATTVMSVNDVQTCSLPSARPSEALAEAFARSAALEEHYLYAQITRLGRLDARERLADWLLETHERLDFVGLASRDRFPLPITQEMLADALGLTSVHVNRTLQGMRRDGLLTIRSGLVVLTNRVRLEQMTDHKPARPYSA